MRFEVLSRHRATAILHAGTKVVAGEEASMPGAGIPLLSAEPEFCVGSRRNDSLGSRWRWAGIRVAVRRVIRTSARIRGIRSVDGAAVFRAGNGGAVPGISMDGAARRGLGADKHLRRSRHRRARAGRKAHATGIQSLLDAG